MGCTPDVISCCRRGMLQEAAGMSAESIARPLIEMVEQDNLKVPCIRFH